MTFSLIQDMNLCFRVASGKHVEIGNGPKTIYIKSCVGEKVGKCHASKEKFWYNIQQFSVPKGSPLYVRIPCFVVIKVF